MQKSFLRTTTALAIGLLIVTAAAVIARLPMFYTVLGAQISPKIIWYDEAYSVFMASHDLLDVIRLAGNDTTPALFVVLLSFWMKIFGSDVQAASFFPFLCSVAAVPAMFFAGRAAGGNTAGVLAAVLVAANPLHVRYATELRAYSLLFLISLLSLMCLIRYLATREIRYAAAWSASLLVGLYCHYTFLAVAIPESVFLVLASQGETKASIMRIQRLALGIGIGLIPQVLMFRRWGDFFGGGASSNLVRGYEHGSLSTFFGYFSSLIFGQEAFYTSNTYQGVFSFVVGATVFSVLISFALRGRRTQVERLLIFTVVAGIILLMVFKLIFAPRYYVGLLAPFLLLVSLMIARLQVSKAVAVMFLMLLFGSGFLFRTYEVPPSQSFVYYGPEFSRRIDAGSESGDLVLIDHYSDMIFRRYSIAKAEIKVFFPRDGRNVTDMFERFRTFDYDFISEKDFSTLEALTAGHHRVWTIDYDPPGSSLQDPAGLKKQWFDGRFMLLDSYYFPAEAPQRIRLSLYERI